jgi:hypothetical protein
LIPVHISFHFSYRYPRVVPILFEITNMKVWPLPFRVSGPGLIARCRGHRKRRLPRNGSWYTRLGEAAYRELKDKESAYAWEWRLPDVSSSAYWLSSTFESWLSRLSPWCMLFDRAG